MSNYLKPHSSEWFTALEKVNPAQAAQTTQTLSIAGRDDVCSIYGDDPVADYKLTSEQTTSSIVATLRLCDDRLNIRRNMHRREFRSVY